MSIAKSSTTRWLTLLCGLVLSAFVCGLYLLNDAWAYNHAFSLAGIYTSYFLDWPQYVRGAHMSYQSSRLLWLTPGWLAYHLLPPYGANLAMHVYVVAGTAVPSWLTLRRLGAGKAGATIGVMSLLANPFFLQAAGWDYVSGAGIIWIAWSLYFLCVAATAARRDGWLFGAGASMIATLLSYLMVAAFAPAYAWIYLRQRGWPETRAAIRELAWLGLGGVACIGTLGLINVKLGGTFWFFLAQFQVADSKMETSENIHLAPEAWLPNAVWLILPCLCLVAALLLMLPSVRRRWGLSRNATAAGGALLLAFAALAALDFSGAWVALQYHAGIHACYLLPFAVLPLGLVIDRHLAHLQPRAQFGWVLAAAILLLAAYYPPIQTRLSSGPMLWPGAIVCVALVAAFLAATYRPTSFGLIIILLGLGWLNPRTIPWTTWQPMSPVPSRDQFLLTFAVLDKMASWDFDNQLMYWFDDHPKGHDDLFLEYYLAYIKNTGHRNGTVLDTFPRFPGLAPKETTPFPVRRSLNLHSGERAVLLGDPVKLPDARLALAKWNLDLRVLDQEVVRQGQASVPMTVLEIVPKRA